LQDQVFDPAQSIFSSLLSYGAMAAMAPIVFGDFNAPAAVTSVPTYPGPMSPNATVDPAVSTVMDQTFQAALLQAGGPAEAEEFSVGSSDAAIASSAAGTNSGATAGPSSADSATAGETPTLAVVSVADGIRPVCTDDETAKALQAGAKFWGPQSVSTPPAQFPGGVVSGSNLGNPLGGLGPSGNPTNLLPAGPAGSWCRPGPTPFYLTSPLEEPLVWIVFGLLTTGVVVFFLSRGVSLPA
jgi:hypothetical protein